MGGISFYTRGKYNEEEKETTDKVAKKLGGKVVKITNQNTPINDNVRHCIYIEKIKSTADKYPRQTGIPTKKPLE